MTHFQTWHALTLLHLAAVASGLLLYVSLTHSGRQRRPPSAAVAWVLALIAFPYLALPVYLLLGTRKLAHTQHEAGRGGNDGPAATRGLDLPRAQHCSSARFHGSGVQALDELLVLLGGAVQRIDIEMFIFRDDAVGVQIIAALEAADRLYLLEVYPAGESPVPGGAAGARPPMALVPVQGAATSSETHAEPSNGEEPGSSTPDDTPPPRGERPKLTRIK